jgi:Uma2 family endonuclease
MAVMVSEAPRYPGAAPFGEWTVEHLAAMPDDGMRYELIDGVLLVTPAPFAPHQSAVTELLYALRGACPPDLRVLVAPFDFQPEGRNSVQPDLLVARRSDLRRQDPLTNTPVLAVEVLSRGTRRKDLTLKRDFYQDFGVAAYWIFDPDVPSILVLELVDGEYRQTRKAVGDEEITVDRPYPVRLCPAALADW